MISNVSYTEAFVWIWLPKETQPVVAGRLSRVAHQLQFNYGRGYLARKNAIPIYEPELPLKPGLLPLINGLPMPSCIRDAAPDAWGRRVILNRTLGRRGKDADTAEIDELTYLLESGSDRTGALDFQQSAVDYKTREAASASLTQLQRAAENIEQGVPLTPEFDAALLHGSSIGGARPKALITAGDKKYVAKFSMQSDLYNVVKAEYIAMRLAAACGINAAPVKLDRAANKDVLLIERFDREKTKAGWQRRGMISALTLLELDEMMVRYASYSDFATVIRHRFDAPRETLRELFSRMVFNVLCGNTDDHARNHAAFWNGRQLSLTPAYDICPQARAGNEATQAMLITGNERLSKIAVCLRAAENFLISENAAIALAKKQITLIKDKWAAVCEDAGLNQVDRKLLWRRQFLNDFAFHEAPTALTKLIQ